MRKTEYRQKGGIGLEPWSINLTLRYRPNSWRGLGMTLCAQSKPFSYALPETDPSLIARLQQVCGPMRMAEVTV